MAGGRGGLAELSSNQGTLPEGLVAMALDRQWVVDMLRRLGYENEAEEAARDLPDPVDQEQLIKFGDRHGISAAELTSRMGGSPDLHESSATFSAICPAPAHPDQPGRKYQADGRIRRCTARADGARLGDVPDGLAGNQRTPETASSPMTSGWRSR
jgi:hypothetical protein